MGNYPANPSDPTMPKQVVLGGFGGGGFGGDGQDQPERRSKKRSKKSRKRERKDEQQMYGSVDDESSGEDSLNIYGPTSTKKTNESEPIFETPRGDSSSNVLH